MDSFRSLVFVDDFAKRIQAAQTDPAQERFIRDFVAGIANDCPLNVITALATCALEHRRAELERAKHGN